MAKLFRAVFAAHSLDPVFRRPEPPVSLPVNPSDETF